MDEFEVITSELDTMLINFHDKIWSHNNDGVAAKIYNDVLFEVSIGINETLWSEISISFRIEYWIN